MNDTDEIIPTVNPSQKMDSNESSEGAVPECDEVPVKCDSDKSTTSGDVGGKIGKPSISKHPVSGSVGTTGGVTRIGRPCNSIPKPAIPRQTPAGVGGGGAMASTSSMRKVSEELARRRISDMNSAEEGSVAVPFFGGGKWTNDRKSSSGSVLSDSSRRSSSDDLRRKKSSDGSLSVDSFGDSGKFDHESRRSSDISVVLTQDTDSFIIGDRVWVGGTKPGQIAYIGETQFAPGDWAGVVLDEPIGKNDGSVANIRYFQCEPKRGIFSRLTRLTRYPLLDGGFAEHVPPKTLPLESAKNHESFAAKTLAKKSSPVPTPTTPMSRSSFSKPSSPDSIIHPNVSVGDRVIVMSSQGSKAGILRFLGATDFAPGEWCGVELDDPLGKNDGSVAGTRYFECRPKFGLFAPLHKVSKSPASRRPSQASCQIHRGGGSVGIRRQGSKESLASMSSIASTAASVRSSTRKVGVRTPTTPTSTKNALQDILKEKELHIEQLLKERDLERAEVTRAASQADEAEKRLAAVQQEFEQSKEELEARVADMDAMICLLKAENEEISGQLEEERKKYEDIQFRFEEVSIESGDQKILVKNLEDKMVALEKNLADERKRVEVLEVESNKLFEAEEQLVIIKEENEALREALARHEKMLEAAHGERAAVEATAAAQEAEIKSLKSEAETWKTAVSRDESKLRDNLSETLNALRETEGKLSRKNAEAEEMQRALQNLAENFSVREKELCDRNSLLLNELQEKHKIEISEMTAKLEELKISSESKLKLLEEKLSEKVNVCSELETKLQEYNLELLNVKSEKSAEEEKRKEAEEKLGKEVTERSELERQITDDLKRETEKAQKYQEEILELRKTVGETNEKLMRKCSSYEEQLSALNQVIAWQEKEMERAKGEADSVAKEVSGLKETLQKRGEEHEAKLREMDAAAMEKDSHVARLMAEVEEVRKQCELKVIKQNESFEGERKELELKIRRLERSREENERVMEALRKELEERNVSLKTKAAEVETERKSREDLLEQLGATRDSHKLLTLEKENLLLAAGDSNRKLQSLEERLMLALKQKEKLENDLTAFINSSSDSTAQVTKLNTELRLKEKELESLREELSAKTGMFEHAQQELKQNFTSKEKEFNTLKENFLEREKELNEKVEILETNLKGVTADRESVESDLRSKLESYIKETESKVKGYEIELSGLRQKAQEKDESHKQIVNDLEKMRKELEERLTLSEGKTLKVESEARIKEKDLGVEIEKLKKELEIVESEGAKRQEEVVGRAKEEVAKYAAANEKLQMEVKERDEKLKRTLQEVDTLKTERSKVEEHRVELESNVAALEKALSESGVSKGEMETRHSALENENKILKDTLNQLREEKRTIEKGVTDKEMLITDLKAQLNTADEWKKKVEEEGDFKNKTIELLKQQVEMAEKCRGEETSEKEKLTLSLKREIESLRSDLEETKSAGKQEAETANAKVSELQRELEARIREIEEKGNQMKEAEERLAIMREALAEEKKRKEEHEKEVAELKRKKVELMKRVEENELVLEKTKELNVGVEELTRKAKEGEEAKETIRMKTAENDSLRRSLEESKLLLGDRENSIKNLSNEVETLRKERTSLLNNNRLAVESLEREKNQLQKKMEEMEAEKSEGPRESRLSAKGAEEKREQLPEDREFTQGQVDFLNSVIVDMQKKNDALKARIEVLEMGFSPEDVEDFTLENLKRGAVAPRLFCDICEVFDLHDTEDCPTQAMDQDDVPRPRFSKTKAPPPPERPYCEVCEVFGHDTADCDDAETF